METKKLLTCPSRMQRSAPTSHAAGNSHIVQRPWSAHACRHDKAKHGVTFPDLRWRARKPSSPRFVLGRLDRVFERRSSCGGRQDGGVASMACWQVSIPCRAMSASSWDALGYLPATSEDLHAWWRGLAPWRVGSFRTLDAVHGDSKLWSRRLSPSGVKRPEGNPYQDGVLCCNWDEFLLIGSRPSCR